MLSRNRRLPRLALLTLVAAAPSLAGCARDLGASSPSSPEEIPDACVLPAADADPSELLCAAGASLLAPGASEGSTGREDVHPAVTGGAALDGRPAPVGSMGLRPAQREARELPSRPKPVGDALDPDALLAPEERYPFAGPPGVPARLVEAVIDEDWTDVNAQGFPALSADGRSVIVIDGDPDFTSESIVLMRVPSGRVVWRVGYPYRPSDPRARRFARINRFLRTHDFRSLPELAGAYGDDHFHGGGVKVEVSPEETGEVLVIRDAGSGEVLARQDMPLAERDDGDMVSSELFAAFVAADRSFVLSVRGACGCWCWMDPEHTVHALR